MLRGAVRGLAEPRVESRALAEEVNQREAGDEAADVRPECNAAHLPAAESR